MDKNTELDPLDRTPNSTHIPPGTPNNLQRALTLLTLQGVAAGLGMPAEEAEMFDEVVFGERTITEAAEKLNIKRTTAQYRYESALAFLRKMAKNKPNVGGMVAELLELLNES